jgi:hypothetical protein
MAQPVPGVGTSAAPAAVIARDGKSVFLAWKGLGNDQRIFWTQTRELAPDSVTGLYTFSPSPQSEASDFCTTDGPALASFQGNVYMAWKGEAGDHAIYWSRWDGASWQPQTKVQAETTISPALVATHDAIFLVFQGNSDKNLWWAMLGDSVGTTNFKVIGPIKVGSNLFQSAATPALAANGNTVYMAWRGGATGNLYWAQCVEDLQVLYPTGNTPDPGGLASYGNYQWQDQQQISPYTQGAWGPTGAGPTGQGPSVAFIPGSGINSGLWLGWVAAVTSAGNAVNVSQYNFTQQPPSWAAYPTTDPTTNQIALIGILSQKGAPFYFFKEPGNDQIFYSTWDPADTAQRTTSGTVASGGEPGVGGDSGPGPENPPPPYTHGSGH